MAARPSMGKTAFCLNVATHAAVEGQGVAIFSLEMSHDQLVQRMLTAEARVDSQRVRQGGLRDADFTNLARAAGVLQSCPVWIDDTPSLSLLEMRSKARRLKAENDIKMVVVDYLQLMRSPEYAENRVQEISDISRSLKALARELEVPVVALSQLSRASEQRGGERRPILSDLRDSGAIEQDADLVLFIHRPEYYDREDDVEEGPGRHHARQEPQRPHRRRAAALQPGIHPLRQLLDPRRPGVAWPAPSRCTAVPSADTTIPSGSAGAKACGAWNTVAEEPLTRPAATRGRPSLRAALGRRPARGPAPRHRRNPPRPLVHRPPRTRLRAGRRHRARLDDAHRRRARHRQVHPAAPGGGPARGRAAAGCSTPAARNPRTSSGSAPTASRKTPGRSTCSAKPGSRRSSRPPPRSPPNSWSSIRSRPSTPIRSRAPPATSARCASPPRC